MKPTNMTTKPLKTPTQERRERRNKAMCDEYKDLMKIEGQSKTQVIGHLMAKYEIGSTSTAYSILKEGGAI